MIQFIVRRPSPTRIGPNTKKGSATAIGRYGSMDGPPDAVKYAKQMANHIGVCSDSSDEPRTPGEKRETIKRTQAQTKRNDSFGWVFAWGLYATPKGLCRCNRHARLRFGLIQNKANHITITPATATRHKIVNQSIPFILLPARKKAEMKVNGTRCES